MNTHDRGSGLVEEGWGTDRRSFLRRVGAGATGTLAAGLAWPGAARGDEPRSGREESAERVSDSHGDQRSRDAEQIRVDAARLARRRPQPEHPDNGRKALRESDRELFEGAPTDQLGEVDPKAYKALLGALSSGRNSDFESIPLGAGRRLDQSAGGARVRPGGS